MFRAQFFGKANEFSFRFIAAAFLFFFLAAFAAHFVFFRFVEPFPHVGVTTHTATHAVVALNHQHPILVAHSHPAPNAAHYVVDTSAVLA